MRDQVTAWRISSYPGVTPTTKRLLDYWNNPENEPRLFFCQCEAVETAIYLNETICVVITAYTFYSHLSYSG